MITGIIIAFVSVLVVAALLKSNYDTPNLEKYKKYDDKNALRETMLHQYEKQNRNYDINKIDVTRFGRMPGSFGRYGYDITNPIVTDDMYKYLGRVVYRGIGVVEDASPICGYKISLFKMPVFHAAVKVEGVSSPILLFFIKGRYDRIFYPRDFFSKFIAELVNEGNKVTLRDNTEELFLLDAEEQIKRKYNVEKAFRLKDSYIRDNWKDFAKNYKPIKTSKPSDVYSAMLRTNKILVEKAREKRQGGQS